MSDLVICLRHGEKPINAEHPCQPVPSDDKNGPGFDEHGREYAHSLTIRGWQRAGALAATYLCGQLGPRASVTPVTFLVPRYVDENGRDESSRHRPHQTVYPLSRRLGQVPLPLDDPPGERHVHADDEGYVQQLYQLITKVCGVAVVCWEHKGLVALAKQLAPEDPPGGWCKERFDVLWRFQRPAPDATYDFERLDQDLLAPDPVDDDNGDAETPPFGECGEHARR